MALGDSRQARRRRNAEIVPEDERRVARGRPGFGEDASPNVQAGDQLMHGSPDRWRETFTDRQEYITE